jgi:hypothetical protein
MGIEDQQEEREVLESIFPEEITGDVMAQDSQNTGANSLQMFPKPSSAY